MSSLPTPFRSRFRRPRLGLALALALLVGGWTASPAPACTIFVLTDGERVLFFNNEDWFNPVTRLWFVPAGKDHLGCAYLGFDDGWAQGGVNTAGLAFDWVSGFDEKNYQPDPALQPVRGNPSERMLESCTTVGEAIAFYRKYREPDFARSRILVADRTGASAVIGSRNGKFHVALLRESRGFGYGRLALEQALARSPAPTVANGAAILRACLQPGPGGTKYSNVFDLKSGGIVLFPEPARDESVTLDLAAELARGGHYYDLAKIREQLDAPAQPLPNTMKRFYLDSFTALPAQPVAVVDRIHSLIGDATAGAMQREHYSPTLWDQLAPAQAGLQADLRRLGSLRSVTIVTADENPELRSYRCLLEFEGARVLQRYDFDAAGRVAHVASEFSEPKPAFVATAP